LTAATAGSTSAPKVTTITDYSTTDTLVLGDATPFQKADISAATTLLGAYAAAVTGLSTGTAGAAWFVYGGNTYVIADADGNDVFSTSDIIVKLSGVYDLSVLAGDATTGLIGVA